MKYMYIFCVYFCNIYLIHLYMYTCKCLFGYYALTVLFMLTQTAPWASFTMECAL